MHGLTVKRWWRYGKDRLYVNLPDGGRVGWLDLQTGQSTLEREDLRAAFEDALRAHASEDAKDLASAPAARSEGPGTAVPPDPAGIPTPSLAAPGQGTSEEPFAITIDWRDLGSRRAGGAAQEQADAQRKAAPVRTFASRVLGVHTDERAWRIGATGERRVAARLDRLPDAWKTLHAIPVGDRGADIDHLVIGPGGVFTINAKHHPDARDGRAVSCPRSSGRRSPSPG